MSEDELSISPKGLVLLFGSVSMILCFWIGYSLGMNTNCHKLTSEEILKNFDYVVIKEHNRLFQTHGMASDFQRLDGLRRAYLTYPQANGLAGLALKNLCSGEYYAK